MSNLFVTLGVKDRGTAILKRFAKNADGSAKKVSKGFKGIGTAAQKAQKRVKTFTGSAIKAMTSLKALVVGVAAAFAMKKLAGSFIETASLAENYQTRLVALLGSVQEGSRLFEEMATFAAGVPFELEHIMGSATQLAGVMKGGVEEIKEWMPLIADLAAVSGMGIAETTGQVVRMYSAGAASADMFRERGILAMLGFQAGVKYSAEDTRKIMMDSWKKAGSQFKGVTAELAKNWTSMVGMLKDKWFIFKKAVMKAEVWDLIKSRFQLILNTMDAFKDTGGLDDFAYKVGITLYNAIASVNNLVFDVLDNWKNIKAEIIDIGTRAQNLANDLKPLLGPLKQIVSLGMKVRSLQMKLGVGALKIAAKGVEAIQGGALEGRGEVYAPPSFATGTGPKGLPETGLFMGHKGEIVKSPAESRAERKGGSGNTYNVTISPAFMTGDRAGAAKAWAELLSYQRQMGR